MAKQIIIKGTPVVAANEVLVADSNSKIPAVDGSAVTTMAGGNITGTIPTARLDTGTTANKVIVVGASGLPAVDGSLLTGIVSYTKSASDPTISTNPATGVGTEWVNHTTGKQFICTDATAGANVWTCSGEGSGNVAPVFFPGESYGYIAGGTYPTSNRINRIDFAVDGNSTDVADILVAGGERTGCSMPNYGYWANGYPANAGGAQIERMSFATQANSTDVGSLTAARRNASSSSSATHCYWTGGQAGINIIERSADASSADAIDVGDLSVGFNNAGNSSDIGGGYGYIHGSYQGTKKVIDRFQFAASASGTDVGDLVQTAAHNGGGASMTYGYSMGGGTPAQNWIQKYAFGSSTSGSDIGNLSNSVWGCCGVSSLTNSYNCGGDTGAGGGNSTDVINKVSHSSDGDGSDIGNLIVTANYLGPVGAQY